MEFISSQKYKIGINEIGGALTSIIDLYDNKELVHQLDDGGWPCQDVMIFPIIGQYEYEIDNNLYNIPTRHGLIRNKNLTFTKLNEYSLLGTYESNDEDLKFYPYKFKLIIKYDIIDDKYKVTFNVFNLDDKTMYFSIGNHLGIKTNDKCYIDLKNNTELLPLEKGLINLNYKTFEYNKFYLKPEMFTKYDTIVMINKTNEVKLVTLSHRFVYQFDSPLFAIWQNPVANNFVCIEPWWGIASYINENKDIKNRYLINKLEPNENKKFSFSITILRN